MVHLFHRETPPRGRRPASPPLNFQGSTRCEPPVLQFRGGDSAPEILYVHTVVGKERIVRELIVLLGEQFVHSLGSTEHLFRHRPHAVTVAEGALPEETPDGEVHGMVRGDHIHAPDLDLPVDEPLHHVRVRAGVRVHVALLVRLGPELREALPPRVQDENISVADLHARLDHLGRVHGEVPHLVAQIDDDAVPVQPFERDLSIVIPLVTK